MKDCTNNIACLAYADDLLLISNSNSKLQQMCNTLSNVLEHHHMSINPLKTIYTSNKPSIPILISGRAILPSHLPFKYLGIWFIANLD